jgi:hypothetical protein
VRADRPRRDEQLLSDRAVGQSFRGELGNLEFLGGELIAGFGVATPA